MKVCAVIDTNVLVSALLSKKEDTATVRVMNELFGGRIIPLYHKDILAEYNEVLRRGKFHLQEATIRFVLDSVIQFGIEVFPQPTGEILTDMDDLIFYKVRISQSEIREGPLGDEVVMEKREDDAYLVTGNQKHYPIRDFIVTPAEMMAILDEAE